MYFAGIFHRRFLPFFFNFPTIYAGYSLVDANWIACSLGIDPSLLITLEGKITEGGKGKIVVVKRYVKKNRKLRLDSWGELMLSVAQHELKNVVKNTFDIKKERKEEREKNTKRL